MDENVNLQDNVPLRVCHTMTKGFSVSSEQQPPTPTQVIHTHRISCRSGKPRELNIYFRFSGFQFWFLLIYFRDGRIGVHIAPKCGTEAL